MNNIGNDMMMTVKLLMMSLTATTSIILSHLYERISNLMLTFEAFDSVRVGCSNPKVSSIIGANVAPFNLSWCRECNARSAILADPYRQWDNVGTFTSNFVITVW
jgi:hypothetical protein